MININNIKNQTLIQVKLIIPLNLAKKFNANNFLPCRKCSVRALADLARQLSILQSLLEQGSKNSNPLYLPMACTPISNEHAHTNKMLFIVVFGFRSLAPVCRRSPNLLRVDRISPRGMTDGQGCAKPYSTLTLPPLCLRRLYTKNKTESNDGSSTSLLKDFLRCGN